MTLYRLGEDAPRLPEEGDFWIAPDANLIGKVEIGAGASVWFGCTLRGDNEPIRVGEGSNIQELCVLHTDMGFPLTVGRDCTIGHKVMLHGCTIGDGSLIGMGATVLNGARIGPRSLVGAGALVTEGREIPEGVLALGAPARVVRDLRPEELDMLEASARHYRENARRFASDLEEIG